MNYKLMTIVLLLLLTIYGESVDTKIRKENLVDMIVTEDSSPWLVPVFTPVVAIHDKYPILVSTNNRAEVEKLIEATSTEKCVYAGNHISYLNKDVAVKKFISDSCVETSVEVIRHFWKRSKMLIFVTMKTPNAVIQASILAAIYGIPIVPIDVTVENNSDSQKKYQKLLQDLLTDLQVEKTMIMGRVPSWIIQLAPSKRYTSSQVQRSIIDNYGNKKIRNVIISRMPKQSYSNESEWIVSYLSFMRRAPVYFTHTPFVNELEANFAKYILRMKLSPKTITLIGNDSQIYTKHIKIPVADDEDYEMSIEPFTLPRKDYALNYGVGRIPFYDLERASLLIVKGFVHELFLTKTKPKVVVAANPSSELLLGETISRITAEEFKNFGVDIKEYYAANYDEQEIRKEVEDAQLVIYEGHVTDQTIFVPPGDGGLLPGLHEGSEDSEDSIYYDNNSNNDFSNGTDDQQYDEYENNENEKSSDSRDYYDDDWEDYAQKEEHNEQVLKAFPFVMLQSCNSLDQSMADYIFGCGGVGLIGTTTNVHSGSGSSILKTICDDILYRDVCVGEALRNARNYFFCLMKLKELRQHKQIAKAKRVALSFRLWGDPELKVLKISKKKRTHNSVKGKFDSDNNKYYINTPINRLPKCETENYYSRMFHDAKVAGLVKSIKNKEQRRVMQLFFFKEKLPRRWLTKHKFKSLYTQKYKDQVRTVFLPSEDKRYMYVLHFPNKIDKKQTTEFQFSTKRDQK